MKIEYFDKARGWGKGWIDSKIKTEVININITGLKNIEIIIHDDRQVKNIIVRNKHTANTLFLCDLKEVSK